MAIQDQAILFSKESAYATTGTFTNAYEGKADSFKRANEYLESNGFRAGMQTKQAGCRMIAINMGGEGSLEIDVLNKGFGFLAQAMLGSASGPTQIDVTDAYQSTHASATGASTDSFSIQVLRDRVGGTIQAFTHKGCVVTGWSLEQQVGGLLTANVDFDFQDVVTSVAAATPVYPTDACPFSYTQGTVSVDGTDMDLTSFSLSAALGMKTDRRFIRGSSLKRQPVRSSVPEYTGEISLEYRDNVLYDLFVSGDKVPVVATWTGEEIDSGEFFEVKVTMPSVIFTGDSPVSSLSDVSMQSSPFTVLHDIDNDLDAVTVEITSSDTSF